MPYDSDAPRNIKLPTFHPGQVELFWLRSDPLYNDTKRANAALWAKNAGGRFRAARCGRRWGKTDWLKSWIGSSALKGHPNGWFAPAYKYTSEVYDEFVTLLEPKITHKSKTDGVIRLEGGGRIDIWTLEDERAGRSRHYKRVAIDEAAFTKSNMLTISWEQSIKPTLLDLTGTCVVASNTNGVDPENFLYAICNDPKHGFIEYHAPSWANPHVPRRLLNEPLDVWKARQQAEYDQLREREHPLVFAQEYAAEFVDWSGVAFFSLDRMFVEGRPATYPPHCDAVFGVIDCATKTGKENDSTAVVWYAYVRATQTLYVLDWDVVQIEGAFLDQWLLRQFPRGEELARECKARRGSLGVWIEDKDAGQILLQKAQAQRWNARPIDSVLTSMGKDERAIAVSSFHWQGKCKITQYAHDKVSVLKGVSRNHFVSQVTGFRIGDKDASKRADDLLDDYTYGLALTFGDKHGI